MADKAQGSAAKSSRRDRRNPRPAEREPGSDEAPEGYAPSPALAAIGATAKTDQELEEALDADFAAWVGTGVGMRCMSYLKSTIMNSVLPATASDGELRYREGSRYLLGVIDTRAARGMKKWPTRRS